MAHYGRMQCIVDASVHYSRMQCVVDVGCQLYERVQCKVYDSGRLCGRMLCIADADGSRL